MIIKSVQYFCYGMNFEYKCMGQINSCLGILCQTNFSFFEIMPLKTYKSVKSVFLYHIQSMIQVESTQEKIKVSIRMRNPKDNFNLYFNTNEEKDIFCGHLNQILAYLREHPYGEFQLKNFIRYSMNISKISNFSNKYSLGKLFYYFYKLKETIENLLEWLKISFKENELENLFDYTIEEISNITIKDIKRVFMVINQKQELISFFKFYAGIQQDQKIGKKKMSIEGFKKFLEQIQNEEYNPEICSQFFSQIKADNIFKFGKSY